MVLSHDWSLSKEGFHVCMEREEEDNLESVQMCLKSNSLAPNTHFNYPTSVTKISETFCFSLDLLSFRRFH